MSDATDAVTVRGHVSRIFFCNPESPAMAGVLDPVGGGAPVRFAGKCAAKEGDLLEVVGEWTEHPRFGRQITVETGLVKLDESPDALAHLLATDKRFKGLGPVKARRVVEAALSLSEDGEIGSALEDYPNEIAAQANVSLEIVQNAAGIWGEKRSHFDAIAALIAQGWTNGQAQTIVHFLGEEAAPLVAADPYSLITKIPRFGFRTVDTVALQMGVEFTSPLRLAAGIGYCLDRIADDGNTWTTRESLLDIAISELRPDTLDAEDRIFEALDDLVSRGIIVKSTAPTGHEIVADARIARTEIEVFDWLLEGMSTEAPALDYGGSEESRDLLFGTLNPGQVAAVYGVGGHRVTVLAGGAGVGKTFTMKAVCRIAEQTGLKISLCAPTGKAARKLEHSTGRKAKTVHRLLEPTFDERTGRFQFRRNAGNPLETDLIVVDEVSMVDVRLMWSLIQAIPESARLLLVGDHNQIPSVGPGAILRDLLAAKERAPDSVHILTDIVRQAGELARNTSAILNGIVAPGESKAWQLRSITRGNEEGSPALVARTIEYVTTTPDLAPFDRQIGLEWDVQVLSPQKKGPVGVFALNTEIQKLRQRLLGNAPPEPTEPNRSPRPLPGDRVIWTTNDYELQLFNGTQAILVAVKKGALELFTEDGREVTIPPAKRKNVEVAYALTIHRSQGSEWPFVILMASSKHWNMHDRNLLYTGASRASEALMVFGDRAGMNHFATERRSVKRQTFGQMLVTGWSMDMGIGIGHDHG